MPRAALKHTYQAAEKFILSREFFGMKLGLENISGFLSDIGSPQERYDTIHLSGTNGKGSSAAMLAAILRQAGFKTGLFTSPHLVTLRERVQINGRLIPKRSVAGFIDRHRTELSRRKISFFELNAAMAFEYFARAKVDIAVIETGLGGRLDATNVLQPRLTITTDISRDHVEILGSSLRKIAIEKAGIIKPGVPHVIGYLPPPAEKVMTEVCRQRKSPLHRLRTSHHTAWPERAEIGFDDGYLRCRRLKLSLWGEHQLRNAATVLKAVSTLKGGGLRISDKAVRRGLAGTVWPGRFQVIEKKRRPTIVLDVGHNERGVKALVDTFRLRFPGRQAIVITGFVKRKPHQMMLNYLGEIAREFWLVPLATHRSVDVAELVAGLDFSDRPVRRFSSLKAAQRNLAKTAQPDDIVIIGGSHFLVGEYLEQFGPR